MTTHLWKDQDLEGVSLKNFAGYSGKIDFLPNGNLYSFDEVRPYRSFINDPDPFSGNDPTLAAPRNAISRLTDGRVWDFSFLDWRFRDGPFTSDRFDYSHIRSFLQSDGSVLILESGEKWQRYFPSENRWEYIKATNAPGAGHATHGFQAIQIGDKIFVWGGIKECKVILPECPPSVFDTNVRTFDLSSMTWTENLVADSPLGRLESKAFPYNEKIIFFGGYGENQPYFDGGIFETTTKKWIQIPSPTQESGIPFDSRIHYSVNLWKTKLIVWGGSLADKLTSSGAIFDLESLTWEAMPDSNISARALHSASVIEDKLIIWGGSGTDLRALKDGGFYELNSNQWLD